MKKILLSALCAIGALSMSAAETTIVFSDIYGDATVSGIDAKEPIVQDGITITFAKGNSTTAPAYNKAKEIRLYGGQADPSLLDGNTMTVAIDGGSITKIDLAVGNVDKWGVITSNVGNVTEDADHNSSWTGNAGEVVFTVSRDAANTSVATQNRYRSITITFDEGEVTKCSAPKFSLEEGAYYSAQSVALTCNTDGATIMYKLNGAEETAYTAPIELKEVGKYTIEAYAKKDGIDNSETVTATYEIKAPVEVSSIAEFIMSGEAEPAGTAFKWNFPVTVTAVMPSYTYVVDGEGSPMLIYGNQIPTYTKGDVIPAGIVGNFKNYNNLYEMEYPVADTFGEATPGSYDYVTMKSGEITTSDINKVIYISNATYTEGESTKTLDDGSGAINVYYQKAWEVDGPTSGEKCDVLCAVAVYKETLQVYPMQFLPAGAGVDGVVANASVVRTIDGAIEIVSEGASVVYNAAGQVVATANGTATVNVPAGFYIVRTADNVVKVLVK